jgi:hypothetical protein
MPMCKGIELGDISGDIGDVFCKKSGVFPCKIAENFVSLHVF